MRDVVIIGCGMTKFARPLPGSLMDIASEASLKAIDDAGVGDRDFDAVYFASMASGEFAHQTAAATALVDELGLIPAPAHRVENGPASGGSVIREAFLGIASGMYDLVLVTGAEKMSAVPGAVVTDVVATMAHHEAEYIHGVTFPGLAAMLTRLYMERYGLTEDQLAAVAVKNHENGSKNPYAQLSHKKATIEGVKDSVMVADPLRLYHVCPVSDGAASLVLCSAEKASEFSGKSIKIAGVGQATDTHAVQEREDPTVLKAVQIASRQAFEMAGLEPKDTDVAELHDAFEILEIAESEDAGFFPKGEGGKAAEEGKTALDGELPINPSGGLKAKGHPVGATGVAQVVELTWQLRGEAGERQVKAAKNAFALNFGGFGDNAVVTILRGTS
ncbi:MAG: thiolase domain-containing protein [Candidatus Hadarchaeota archaeon]|nr:thiolase domain-containing protein [Candidatus Hadarchaeota archaeon]